MCDCCYGEPVAGGQTKGPATQGLAAKLRTSQHIQFICPHCIQYTTAENTSFVNELSFRTILSYNKNTQDMVENIEAQAQGGKQNKAKQNQL